MNVLSLVESPWYFIKFFNFEFYYPIQHQPTTTNNFPPISIPRLDAKTPLGYAWLLISWIPDSATIRQKMLYASTKATLKTEFGSAHITEEIHATDIVRIQSSIVISMFLFLPSIKIESPTLIAHTTRMK